MRNILEKPTTPRSNSDWLELKESESGKALLHPCPSKPYIPATRRTGALVWDRLAGDYNPVKNMRWIRFYNQLVCTGLTKYELNGKEIIWLKDYQQWITEDDFRELDDTCTVGNDYYAERPDDVMWCSYSDEYHYDCDMVRIEDEGDYCYSEYASNHFYCSDNGDYYRYEENMPEYVSSAGLRDYDDRAEDILEFGDDDACLKLNDKPLFLGVELEVNATGDRRETAEAIDGKDCICKEDGSLDERKGFEIVTKPMSLDDTTTFIERLIRNYGDDITSPSSGYGLHMHISKECLSKREQARIAAFISNPAHHEYLLEFSRRPSVSNYAKFVNVLKSDYFFSKTRSNKKQYYQKRKDFKQLITHDRYQAINFTNEKTVEFRFFNSTVDKQELLQSIEFCQAIAHYIVNTIDCPAREVLTIQAFNKWAMEPAKLELYPNYNLYINPENQEQLELIAA